MLGRRQWESEVLDPISVGPGQVDRATVSTLEPDYFPRFAGSKFGGANRNRTDDLLNAIQALSQLSYGPTRPGRVRPAKEVREGTRTVRRRLLNRPS